MLKIGVTGGIGAGKSIICRVFHILGVPVYNADERARALMEENQEVKQNLLKAFGNEVFRDGRPDRKALASLVFGNMDALNEINRIIHPAVRSDFFSWLGEHKNEPYVIKEAAILFETGSWREMDGNILVTAPVEIRTGRIMKRDGVTREEVLRRMENQWTDEKKIPLAGVVIKNDDSGPVLPVLLGLHAELSRGELPAAFGSGADAGKDMN